MSRLADVQALGYLPLQDHRSETDVDLEFRAAVFACRIESRDKFGRYIAQGHQGNLSGVGSTNPVKTVGDVLGGTFYQQEKDKRATGSWSFAMPAMTTAASLIPDDDAPIKSVSPGQSAPPERVAKLLPVKGQDWSKDDRFKEIEVSVLKSAPPLPKGIPGVVLSATEERGQETLFLPSFSPLVSVSRGEGRDKSLSSLVYDVTTEGELDEDYHAPLHTMLRVCKIKDQSQLGQSGASLKDSLALKLGSFFDLSVDGGLAVGFESGPSGYKAGLGSFQKGSTRVGSRATATSSGSGARVVYAALSSVLDVGSVDDIHRTGVTEDGSPINAMHVRCSAPFKNLVGDGPLEFGSYYEKNVVDKPFLSRVYLRFDDNSSPITPDPLIRNQYVWKWQAESNTYIPERDGNPPPPPPPPPPPEPEPYPPFPPFPPLPPAGGGPGGVGPAGGGPGVSGPGGKEEEDDDVQDWVPQPFGAGGIGYGWPLVASVGQGPEVLKKVLQGVLAQTQTFAGDCRMAGGLKFRPYATAVGEWDLTKGGKPKSKHLEGQIKAPDTAVLVGVGQNNTGRWNDFTDDGKQVKGGSRTGPGGIAFLPPEYGDPAKLGDVLAGTLQPASFAHPWSEKTRAAKLFLPGGLASLEFSHPAPGGQRGGVSIFQDSTGLVIAPRDADGVLTSNTALQITEGSVKVTGKLDVTGLIDPTGLAFDKQSATSIGGSAYGLWASDGTVSGTVNGALYYDDAGTRRRVAAPLKHVASPGATKAGSVALTSHVMSYSGCGLVETSYITSEATVELLASPVASEGQLLSVESDDSNANQFFTIRRYVPEGFTSWAAEGVRLRHKVTAVSSGDTAISLTVRQADGSTAVTVRTVSSADSAYQWITVAGSSLSALGAGEYIEVQIQLANDPSAEAVVTQLGRLEFNWL